MIADCTDGKGEDARQLGGARGVVQRSEQPRPGPAQQGVQRTRRRATGGLPQRPRGPARATAHRRMPPLRGCGDPGRTAGPARPAVWGGSFGTAPELERQSAIRHRPRGAHSAAGAMAPAGPCGRRRESGGAIGRDPRLSGRLGRLVAGLPAHRDAGRGPDRRPGCCGRLSGSGSSPHWSLSWGCPCSSSQRIRRSRSPQGCWVWPVWGSPTSWASSGGSSSRCPRTCAVMHSPCPRPG